MTVWVVNHTKDDLSAARQWGDLRFINVRYVYADELINCQMPGDFVNNIRDAAEGFDPEKDYLLLAGDYVQMAAFAAELGRLSPGFRMLRWDKIAQGYIPFVWIF